MYWRGHLLWLLDIHLSLTARNLPAFSWDNFHWDWDINFKLPDCTSPSLGVKDDFLYKTQHPSTLLPAHRAVPAAAQSRKLGSYNWDHPSHPGLSDCHSSLFGMPSERLKKQSLKQSLGNLPQDTVNKRVVSISKAFLGNPKEVIHFVEEEKEIQVWWRSWRKTVGKSCADEPHNKWTHYKIEAIK